MNNIYLNIIFVFGISCLLSLFISIVNHYETQRNKDQELVASLCLAGKIDRFLCQLEGYKIPKR